MIPFGERATKIIAENYIVKNGIHVDKWLDCIVSDIVESQWLFIKSLVLEFNKLKFAGFLVGETSEERYNSFFRVLATDRYIEYFLKTYPVYGDFLSKTIENSLDSLISSSQFLENRKEEIEEKFGIKLINPRFVKFVGDRHPNEKRNILIETGGTLLVIKHRDNFSRYMLAKITDLIKNDIKEIPYFLKYYSSEGFIIEEWIDDPKSGYYSGKSAYQFGVISALVVLTRGQDLHHENVIQSISKGPVIIDYECFFSPIIRDIDKRLDFILLLIYSGLLPFSMTSAETGKSIEVGALLSSLESELSTPLKLHYLENDFTDNLKLVYKFQKSQNASSPNAIHSLKKEDAKIIVNGFRDACFSILKNKNQIINIFQSSRTEKSYSRSVLKPTQYYYDLVRRFYHPKFAANPLLFQESVEEQLKISGSEYKYLIKSEFESIIIAGSPLFTIGWNDTSISSNFGATGKKTLKSCKDSVLSSLEAFTADNVELLIKTMMKSISGKIGIPDSSNLDYADNICGIELSFDSIRDNILKEVDIIIDSFLSKEKGGMVDLVESRAGGYEISVIDNGLYSGISGIYYSLLMAHLSIGDNRYLELKDAVHNLYKSLNPSTINPSLFTGDLGIIYSLLVEWKILSTELEFDKLDDLLESATSKIIETNHWDLFSGSSGVLLLLARMKHLGLCNLNSLEKNADKIIDHLDSLKIIDDAGHIWWPQPFGEQENLGGFAHGVAGVAYALSFWKTNNSKAELLYRSAIKSQESLYLGDGRWLDARGFKNNEITSSASWCHGGLGIMKIFSGIDRKSGYKSENFDYTLCHGLVGNIIDNLICSDLQGAKSGVKKLISRRISARKDPICFPDFLIDGLFLGRAGVIFALSSFINPDVLKYNCIYLDVGFKD